MPKGRYKRGKGAGSLRQMCNAHQDPLSGIPLCDMSANCGGGPVLDGFISLAARDSNDPKSGLAKPNHSNHTAKLSGPDLGCIEADFCNQMFILHQFSRSTRFACFCTAPKWDVTAKKDSHD